MLIIFSYFSTEIPRDLIDPYVLQVHNGREP
jgi:hypothetical protein